MSTLTELRTKLDQLSWEKYGSYSYSCGLYGSLLVDVLENTTSISDAILILKTTLILLEESLEK